MTPKPLHVGRIALLASSLALAGLAPERVGADVAAKMHAVVEASIAADEGVNPETRVDDFARMRFGFSRVPSRTRPLGIAAEY